MPKNAQQLEDDLGALSVKITNIVTQVENLGQNYKDQLSKNGAAVDEVKNKLDDNLTALNATKASIAEIEKKLAAIRDGAGPSQARSAGAEVAASEEWKAFVAGDGRNKMRFQVKNAITSITTDTDGAAGDLVVPDRRAGVFMLPQRRMTIRQLLMPGNTTSNAIEYVKQTGFTNAAAMVSEGAQKPESTMKFELETRTVKTLAHWVQASRQILADAPQLRSMIDGQLRYGLQYVEEAQLLKGDGTGQNLSGLWNEATPFSAAFVPELVTYIDYLRLAMLQAALAEWPATGHVLNPIDWARIELSKDTTGRYLIGDPQGVLGPRLWGLPVVPTQALDEGEFLTGAFTPAAQIFDREGTTVLASLEDRDNFIKNMITILAEQRLALAIYRPEALIKGNFGDLNT